MAFERLSRLLSIMSVFSWLFLAEQASSLTIYRIGAPFTAAERDSLGGLGIEFREIDWLPLQLGEALEPDSLQVGSLQPNFIDEGEDIARTLLDRDGWIGVTDFANIDRLTPRVLVDGNEETSYTWVAIAPESFDAARSRNEQLTVDLGGRFLVHEVRFRPLADKPEHFLEKFVIGATNESFRHGNSVPNFQVVADIKENFEPEVSVIFDPPITTLALQLRISRQTLKEIGLASFEVYGGGFVTPAAYESDVIELDDIASLGEITWAGKRDPSAQVAIRTRAGLDPHPVVFWETRPEQQDSVRYLDGGGDLTLTEYKGKYNRLEDIYKPVNYGDKVTFDTENWSFWSSPYEFENPGVAFISPGPRRYVQIRADFASTVEDGGNIDYIQFEATSPPLVGQLVGEVFPLETTVGEPTRFTYYFSPTIPPGAGGFDGVEISTPSGVVSVDSVRIDAVNQDDFSWKVREDGLGFEVLLPRRLEQSDNGTIVEVVFTAPVFREVGTRFDGRVFDTLKPLEVRQRIVPGNAIDEVPSDGVAIRTSLSRSLLFSPSVSPNPFTPNGDGVNDVVNISYTLLRVTSGVPVTIEVFDLSGRLVKQVHSGVDLIGQYAYTWDGTDGSGSIVPPGLYLYRIDADVHLEKEISSGIISVAY